MRRSQPVLVTIDGQQTQINYRTSTMERALRLATNSPLVRNALAAGSVVSVLPIAC